MSRITEYILIRFSKMIVTKIWRRQWSEWRMLLVYVCVLVSVSLVYRLRTTVTFEAIYMQGKDEKSGCGTSKAPDADGITKVRRKLP